MEPTAVPTVQPMPSLFTEDSTQLPSQSTYYSTPMPTLKPICADGPEVVAVFAEEGDRLALQFTSFLDTSTPLHSSFCKSSFNISGIVSCKFNSDVSIQLTLGYNSSLLPNDVLCYESGLLSLDSFGCLVQSFCIVVSPPLNPTTPTGFLSGQQYFSECFDTISVLAQGLSGSGSRPFTVFHWEVSPTIPDALDFFDFVPLLSLNSSLFIPDLEYTISLVLENFLGVSVKLTTNLTLNNGYLPSVYVVPPMVEIHAYEELDFQARASPSCTTMEPLDFQWDVIGFPEVASLSSSPSVFFASAYTFNASQTYTIRVTVQDSGGLSSMFHARVSVLEAEPIVNVFGGSYFFFGENSMAELDASGSYNINLPKDKRSKSDVSFYWDCFDLISNSSCSHIISDIAAAKILSFNTSRLGIGNYSFTASATVGNAHSSQDVYVYVERSNFPQVYAVLEHESNTCSEEENLVVYGEVSMQTIENVTALWAFTSKPHALLSTKSLADYVAPDDTRRQFRFTKSISSYHFNVEIPCKRLLPGSYTLKLSAFANSEEYSSAYSKVHFVKSSSPRGGTCAIFPKEGIEWLTSFETSCQLWSGGDMPFRYKWNYAIGTRHFVASPETIESSSTISFLPSSVDCLSVRICNQLSACGWFDGIGIKIAQSSLNDSEIVSLANNAIEVFSGVGDYKGVQLATVALSSSISHLNFSVNCTELNREEYSAETNTCGSCLLGLTGITGGSNTPCVSDLPSHCDDGILNSDETCLDGGGSCPYECGMGDPCLANQDCVSGFCNQTSLECAAPLKQCPGNPTECSGIGVCEYYDGSGNVVEDALCTVDSAGCFPECVCGSNFYGVACQYTHTEYDQKSKQVAAIMTGMAIWAGSLDPDENSIKDMVVTLWYLSGSHDLFSAESINKAISVIMTVLEGVYSVGKVSDETLKLVLSTMANLGIEFQNSTITHGANRRRFLEASNNDPLTSVMRMWTEEAVPGAGPHFLSTSKHMVASAAFNSMNICGESLDLPLSDLEISLQKGVSRLDFGSGCQNGFSGVDIFVLFERLHSFTSTVDTFEVAISYQPGVFSTSLNFSEVSRRLENRTLVLDILMQNNQKVEYTSAQLISNEFVECGSGDTSTHWVQCPAELGLTPVEVACFGTEGRWNLSCVGNSTGPSCGVGGGGAAVGRCTPVGWDAEATACRCALGLGDALRPGPGAWASWTLTGSTVKRPAQILYSFKPGSIPDLDEPIGGTNTYYTDETNSDWFGAAMLSAGAPFVALLMVLLYRTRRKRMAVRPAGGGPAAAPPPPPSQYGGPGPGALVSLLPGTARTFPLPPRSAAAAAATPTGRPSARGPSPSLTVPRRGGGGGAWAAAAPRGQGAMGDGGWLEEERGEEVRPPALAAAATKGKRVLPEGAFTQVYDHSRGRKRSQVQPLDEGRSALPSPGPPARHSDDLAAHTVHPLQGDAGASRRRRSSGRIILPPMEPRRRVTSRYQGLGQISASLGEAREFKRRAESELAALRAELDAENHRSRQIQDEIHRLQTRSSSRGRNFTNNEEGGARKDVNKSGSPLTSQVHRGVCQGSDSFRRWEQEHVHGPPSFATTRSTSPGGRSLDPFFSSTEDRSPSEGVTTHEESGSAVSKVDVIDQLSVRSTDDHPPRFFLPRENDNLRGSSSSRRWEQEHIHSPPSFSGLPSPRGRSLGPSSRPTEDSPSEMATTPDRSASSFRGVHATAKLPRRSPDDYPPSFFPPRESGHTQSTERGWLSSSSPQQNSYTQARRGQHRYPAFFPPTPSSTSSTQEEEGVGPSFLNPQQLDPNISEETHHLALNPAPGRGYSSIQLESGFQQGSSPPLIQSQGSGAAQQQQQSLLASSFGTLPVGPQSQQQHNIALSYEDPSVQDQNLVLSSALQSYPGEPQNGHMSLANPSFFTTSGAQNHAGSDDESRAATRVQVLAYNNMADPNANLPELEEAKDNDGEEGGSQ